MSKLYVDVDDPITLMEMMDSESFQMILMEAPFNTGNSKRWLYECGEKKEDEEYGIYISHLVENAARLLDETGILCFPITSRMSSDYNYQMILEHFFNSILQITLLDQKKQPARLSPTTHIIIYCCSKQLDYDFPVLYEKGDITKFRYVDSEGRHYRKRVAIRPIQLYKINKLRYSWRGIVPAENSSWIYTEEKLEEEYRKGNILIENGKVFIKELYDDYNVPISTVWENDNTRSSISERNYDRLIKMFSDEGNKLFCPFERDGMFSWCAFKSARDWTSISFLWNPKRNRMEQIPSEMYTVEHMSAVNSSIQYEKVIKSRKDVDELSESIKKLQISIRALQDTVGVDEEDDDVIDDVIEKIHLKIIESFSDQNISTYYPEVQEWVAPYWDKLEDESRYFLPTGAFLFKQFDLQPGADYAPAMIEYCRSLEKEIFVKLFKGYIENLISRGIDIHGSFTESFLNNETKVFAKFLSKCVNDNPTNPDMWKFELGKMAFVLTRVLAGTQWHPLYADFRNYLNNVFDQHFFGEHFADQLSYISSLRNACAHPSIVGQSEVISGRELIRQKLNSILAYYN